ncbi:MAG: hypothetical protein WD603_00580 [Patescibacteria group bacterium]
MSAEKSQDGYERSGEQLALDPELWPDGIAQRLERSADRFEADIHRIGAEAPQGLEQYVEQWSELEQYLSDIQRLERMRGRNDHFEFAEGFVAESGQQSRRKAMRHMRRSDRLQSQHRTDESRKAFYDKNETIGQNIAVKRLGRLQWAYRPGNRERFDEMLVSATESLLREEERAWQGRQEAA